MRHRNRRLRHEQNMRRIDAEAQTPKPKMETAQASPTPSSYRERAPRRLARIIRSLFRRKV